MDEQGLAKVRAEVAQRLAEICLVEFHPESWRLVCPPIGTVPKPRSTKLRIIHHLSHLRAPGSGLPSVNPGVARSSTAIQDVTLAAVLDYARLLGRMLDVHFFAETVLTFGGKSSPLLFDLFAEMPHWIMASFTPHPVEHDLDDLFGAVA
ncbi:uncharacterized protein PSFLO_06861 [Pseudozyma flocculosa]|uniref:Uncharacterized protein n=1 Tax=Pseudozyma flocculosa TaxID=84751 RepID=A0A5C3FDE5_9BASI|nr:uncharacterized protein PSFLO_06861 [Pseudozyma flocculosa]